jgi:sugar-specific transcriptional regulator TrmB
MELNELLERLKLNSYEKAAYIALLKLGNSKASDIYKLAKVPQGRIYDTLNALERMGLITTISKDPKVFQAGDPKVNLAVYLKKQKADVDNLLSNIDKISMPKQVEKMASDASKYYQVLTGRATHLETVIKLKSEAKKEILQYSFSHVGTTASKVAAIKLLKRKGVKSKFIIYGVRPDNKERLKNEIKHGAQIRVNSSVRYLSFLVCDGKKALLSLNPPEIAGRAFIFMDSPKFASTLADLFIDSWKKSEPLTISKINKMFKN